MQSVVGFLYGHYDSRGGATFLVADSRNKADLNYAALFAFTQKEFCSELRWFWLDESTPILKSELTPTGFPAICDEDFILGPVMLELQDGHPALDPVWREGPGRIPGGMELLDVYADGDPDDKWAGEIYALARPGMTGIQFDEQDPTHIIKLRLYNKNELVYTDGEPPKELYHPDGIWYLTDYGEDACGVVLQFAVDNPEAV